MTDLLPRIRNELGITVLIIEHDMALGEPCLRPPGGDERGQQLPLGRPAGRALDLAVVGSLMGMADTPADSGEKGRPSVNQLAAIAVGVICPSCIYALIAVGFVLIYRATRIFNFAQGQFVFISALLFVTAYNHFGSLILAGFISLAVSMVIGAVMYLVLMRPLQGQSIFIMVMVTLILATSFLNGIIAIIWGVNVYPLNR